MELTDFLHADTNSGKIKVASVILGWVWLKMGMATWIRRLWNWVYLKNGLKNFG